MPHGIKNEDFSPCAVHVTNASTLLTLLDKLDTIPLNPPPLLPPSLYFDTEGIRLGIHGSIDAILLLNRRDQCVYTIKISVLGPSAFSTVNKSGLSLKQVLESKEIPKVFFDVRNHSHALYNLYGISLAGVLDLQLMALAANNIEERKKGNRVYSLQCYIEQDLHKYKGTTGGEIGQSALPMARDYDTMAQMMLWKVYAAELCKPEHSFSRSMIKRDTDGRIKLAKSKTYHEDVADKGSGPWKSWDVEQASDAWNENVLEIGQGEGGALQELSFGEFR